MTYDDYVQSGLKSYQILGAYPTGPQYDESGAPIDTSNQVAMRWPDETGALNELRRRNGIPDQYSNDQIKQWAQAVIPTMPENHGQSFGSQLMDFAGPGSPMAWMASMAFGGPVAGTIAAANGSGATQSLGIDPRLTTAASLAYGSTDGAPAGPNGVPSSDGGAMDMGQGMDGVYDYQSPMNQSFWDNTYAANNTGTMTDASPNPGAGGNTPMFDDYGNPLLDDSGGLFSPSSGGLNSIPGMSGPGAFDESGSMSSPGGSSTIFGGTAGNPFGNLDIMGLVKKYGPLVVSKLLGKGGGGGGGLGGGAANPSDPLSGLLNMGAQAAPGLAALLYANSQPGIDTGPLQGILGQLGGNQDAVIRAATDPVQQNISGAYGDLLQSQGVRGIRGSSFGDSDISSFLSSSSRTLANAGANAAEGSLALQGNLAGNIANLKNQAQQIKNNLFGKAFDVLGRGLSPAPTFSMAG